MASGGDLTNKAWTLVWQVGSLVTQGDGKAAVIIPHDCYLLGPVQAQVGTAPSSSGSLKVQLRNATDSVDLLTSKITVTTTDSDRAAEGTLVGTTSRLSLSDGDVICVDVDSISAGATERYLTVQAQVVGR